VVDGGRERRTERGQRRAVHHLHRRILAEQQQPSFDAGEQTRGLASIGPDVGSDRAEFVGVDFDESTGRGADDGPIGQAGDGYLTAQLDASSGAHVGSNPKKASGRQRGQHATVVEDNEIERRARHIDHGAR
jgi:hypothetical protein